MNERIHIINLKNTKINVEQMLSHLMPTRNFETRINRLKN